MRDSHKQHHVIDLGLIIIGGLLIAISISFVLSPENSRALFLNMPETDENHVYETRESLHGRDAVDQEAIDSWRSRVSRRTLRATGEASESNEKRLTTKFDKSKIVREAHVRRRDAYASEEAQYQVRESVKYPSLKNKVRETWTNRAEKKLIERTQSDDLPARFQARKERRQAALYVRHDSEKPTYTEREKTREERIADRFARRARSTRATKFVRRSDVNYHTAAVERRLRARIRENPVYSDTNPDVETTTEEEVETTEE